MKKFYLDTKTKPRGIKWLAGGPHVEPVLEPRNVSVWCHVVFTFMSLFALPFTAWKSFFCMKSKDPNKSHRILFYNSVMLNHSPLQLACLTIVWVVTPWTPQTTVFQSKNYCNIYLSNMFSRIYANISWFSLGWVSHLLCFSTPKDYAAYCSIFPFCGIMIA